MPGHKYNMNKDDDKSFFRKYINDRGVIKVEAYPGQPKG